MEFPDNQATRDTEKLMALIKENIKTENHPHNYNRVYEKAYAFFRKKEKGEN